MKKIALLGIVALAGCSSAPPLFTPDGRATMQVQCTGGSDWSECERRAQVACGSGGYDVLNRTDSSSNRSMYIACRKPAQTF